MSQILRRDRDFVRAANHADGGPADRGHGLAQAVDSFVEVGAQRLIFGGEGLLQRQGQIAGRQPRQGVGQTFDHLGLGAGRQRAIIFTAFTLPLGGVTVGRGLLFKAKLFNGGVLEGQNRVGHFADFVPAVRRRDLNLVIAVR